jgi:two-component system response regulator NreC
MQNTSRRGVEEKRPEAPLRGHVHRGTPLSETPFYPYFSPRASTPGPIMCPAEKSPRKTRKRAPLTPRAAGAPRRGQARVLIADDHPAVLTGVRALLESRGWDVVAEAKDGQEAVRLARRLRPDVAVLDVVMPLLDGVSAAREMARSVPGIGLIVLTGMPGEPTVPEALSAGVRGLVLKTEVAEDLVEAVREVARGVTYVSPLYSRTVGARRAEGHASRKPLSPREREVLQLIAAGQTTREVAARLGISVKTAEGYRENILEKLQVHGTAGLVRYAIRTGLISA